MTKKKNKTITKLPDGLQFISEEGVSQEILQDHASLTMNPYIRWAKFILTDDLPNGNGVRIPEEEFDNLISSGINMPIKMAEGRIEEDHSDAVPIGVIANLKKEVINGINAIVGLAALWLYERPGDVTYLKSKMDNGENVDISWEIGFADRTRDENGIINYHDVALQAATIVGNPAYRGRTRFLDMASQRWTSDYIKNLPDSSFLYIERVGDLEGKPQQKRYFPVKDGTGLLDVEKLKGVLAEADSSGVPQKYLESIKEIVTELLARFDAGASLIDISNEIAPLENNVTEEDTVELEQLKQRVSELETELESTKAKLADKETELNKASESIASLSGEKDSMTSELTELRTYKTEIEAEVAKVEKLENIKAKFSEASLEKDEKYFEDNAEKLLNMAPEALDFMIQEFVSFSKTDAEASLERGKLPNVPGEGAAGIDVHELAKALKERARKSK